MGATGFTRRSALERDRPYPAKLSRSSALLRGVADFPVKLRAHGALLRGGPGRYPEPMHPIIVPTGFAP
jgi:hypothetical protein